MSAADDFLLARSWHRIRLPAPWQASPLVSEEGTRQRIGIQFVRRFQRPTGLAPGSQVMLEIQLRDSLGLEHSDALIAESVALSQPTHERSVVARLNGHDCTLQEITPLLYHAELVVEKLGAVNELTICVQDHNKKKAMDGNQLADILESVALLLKA